MIYYIYGHTIKEFMQKVNGAVIHGHVLIAMDVTEGNLSYRAKMCTKHIDRYIPRWVKQ